MIRNEYPSVLVHLSRGIALVLAAILLPRAQAATIWTGSSISFTKANGADPNQAANQDRMTSNVWLTRGSSQGLYNARTEASFTHSFSPAGTEWANGTLDNYEALSYTDWNNWAKGVNAGPPSTVGVNAVVHLIAEDIYLSVKFTSWGAGGGGGFSYTRSTPAAAAPTVNITSPSAGAIFLAPASVGLTANASVSGGTVTNVEYFAGTTSLGHATVSPFSVTGNIATPGPYPLTAVATAGGVSRTSAVVNITVVSRPVVTITAPTNGAVFAAPANVAMSANTTVSGSTVTNVSFFNSTTLLGSDTSAPFNLTASNLAAGAYSLSAIAKASGISGTSSVINITVVSPGAISLTPSLGGSNGLFSFSYVADPGLSYVIQRARLVGASNLFDWISVATNIASSNRVQFSDSSATNSSGFYRVGRLPNP